MPCRQRVIVNQLGEMRVRPNTLELQLQGKRKVNPHYLESYRTALQVSGPGQAGWGTRGSIPCS